MLSIYEKLFLLALDEEKGNPIQFAKKTLGHALSGSILAELALLGKINCNEKRRLEVKDASITQNPVLDDVLKEIKASEKARRVSYWISQLSSKPKVQREKIGGNLVSREILYQEERRLYWKTNPEEATDPTAVKFNIKNPLRSMILTSTDDDLNDLSLLTVLSASGLLNLVFTLDEIPLAQKRIQEKIVRKSLEDPIIETIQNIEQGIITSLEDDLD
jgi:golgi phosphoprotein 3